MIVCGIDPGNRGAFAAIKNGEKIVWLCDLPTKELPSGKRMICARQMTDVLKQLISEHPHEKFAVMLEKVGSRPGEGVVGAFTFGRGFGIVEASIIARGLPLEMVTPQVWKRAMSMTADKDDVRIKMMKKFPQVANMLKRKMDDGRAEALAIALYCWQRDYA